MRLIFTNLQQLINQSLPSISYYLGLIIDIKCSSTLAITQSVLQNPFINSQITHESKKDQEEQINTLQEDLQGDSSSEEVSKEQKFGLAGLLGSTNDLLNAESKNKRLRQSANNFRLRKKVYLKLLEKRFLIQIKKYRNIKKQQDNHLNI